MTNYYISDEEVSIDMEQQQRRTSENMSNKKKCLYYWILFGLPFAGMVFFGIGMYQTHQLFYLSNEINNNCLHHPATTDAAVAATTATNITNTTTTEDNFSIVINERRMQLIKKRT